MTEQGSMFIQVPSELFALAESSVFEGTYDIGTLDAGPDSYEFAEPVQWSITLTNTGGALLASGFARGTAVTQCARCLDDVTFQVDGQVEGYILIGDTEAPEDMDDDEFEYLPEDGKLDAEPLVVAALLMDIPLIPLCDDECAGLCGTCGWNLNEGPCECQKLGDDVDDMHPFAALKGLKFDD